MSKPDSPAQKVNALVIDDGEIEHKLMAHFLSQVTTYDVKYFSAKGCTEAIDVLNTEGIDVCFLDYYLDGETGIDLVEQLAQLGIVIPIVMITGLDEQELERLVRPHGIEHILSKEQLSGSQLDATLIAVLT